jgi:hypothetical protein
MLAENVFAREQYVALSAGNSARVARAMTILRSVENALFFAFPIKSEALSRSNQGLGNI